MSFLILINIGVAVYETFCSIKEYLRKEKTEKGEKEGLPEGKEVMEKKDSVQNLKLKVKNEDAKIDKNANLEKSNSIQNQKESKVAKKSSERRKKRWKKKKKKRRGEPGSGENIVIFLFFNFIPFLPYF